MYCSKTLSLTLFFALTLLVEASSSTDSNALARRGHENRMMKKRSPQRERVQESSTSSSNGVVASSTSSSSSTSTSTSTSSSTPTTPTATPSSSSSTSSTTSSRETTSSSSSTRSTTSSTPSSAPTPTANTPTPVQTPTPAPSSEPGLNIVSGRPSIPTASPSAGLANNPSAAGTQETPSATPTETPKASGALSTTALTIIIALAASIGGAGLIWTIIRKWKFRPSAEFEDRMQPIDWEPHTDATDGVPGLHRTTSRGSGRSGSVDNSLPARGAQPGLVPDLPPHDFTAGPHHLQPMGGYADIARGPSPTPQIPLGGYSDITRGPTPGPQMQSLSRGPSIGNSYGATGHTQGANLEPAAYYNAAGNNRAYEGQGYEGQTYPAAAPGAYAVNDPYNYNSNAYPAPRY